MSIAHTCLRCGLNLAPIAAPLDPIYRLPIVVCPECREPSVRHSDGHRVVPREIDRLRRAIRNTAFSLFGLCVAVGSTIGATAILLASAHDAGLQPIEIAAMIARVMPRDGRYEDWASSSSPIGMLAWFIMSAGVGTYLTAALPHLSRRRFLLVFGAVTLVALFTYGTIEQIDEYSVRPMISPIQFEYPEELKILANLPLTAAGALAGIPLGRRARRSGLAFQAVRWRKLRTRIRKRRQSQ